MTVTYNVRALNIIKALETIKPETFYKPTDIGDGRLYADVFKNYARFCPESKCWFVYNGKYWETDVGNVKAMGLCQELANSLSRYGASLTDNDTSKEAFLKHAATWQNRHKRETILKDAQPIYQVKAKEFNANPDLLNLENGTLHLDTLDFTNHSPDDLLSKMANVEYRPDAKCERWEQFIKEIMQSDNQIDTNPQTDNVELLNSIVTMGDYLQRVIGYALTGTCSEEQFWILHGTNRNGKGVFVESITGMLGDYARNARAETIAQRRYGNGNGPSEDIARLAGARLVAISELDRGMKIDSAIIKTLTGRDTISARFLNQNSFEFRPQFAIVISSNYLPSITDPAVFDSRRLVVIPFRNRFGGDKCDPDLKEKFAKAEARSAILNWALAGLQRYKEIGLKQPEDTIEAINDYRLDSDNLQHFLDERCDKDETAEIKPKTMYDSYEKWCKDNSINMDGYQSFLTDCRIKGICERRRPKDKNLGESKINLISGYRLKKQQILPYYQY